MSELDLIARQIHPGSLYREETFTDRKTATIRVLTPVTEDGAFDGTRSAVYLGDTQLLTNTGVLPLVFDLEARSLADATAKFASAARATVERTLEKLEDLRGRTAPSVIDATENGTDPASDGFFGGVAPCFRGGGGLRETVRHAAGAAARGQPHAARDPHGLAADLRGAEGGLDRVGRAWTGAAGESARVPVRSVVLEGKEAAIIARVARTRHASHIVMGTHGRSGLAGLVLGTVAARVLAIAPCPVLTVRARGGRWGHGRLRSSRSPTRSR